MTAIVTVYTRPACPGCNATKKHLDRLDIPFTEQPITDADEQLAAAFAELGCGTAPVVCASVDGQELTWDGYRPDRINALGGAR